MTSLPEICLADDCERPKGKNYRGYCSRCYQRKRKDGSLPLLPRLPEFCEIEDCDRAAQARNWCSTHYQRWITTGTTDWPGKRAEYRQPPRDWTPEQVREARNERHREYNRANADKWDGYHHERRARMAGATYESVSVKDVITLYGTTCHLCDDPIDLDAPRSSRSGSGWERGLHLDHVTPLSKGGTHTIENVRPAHGWCNLSKGAKL